jgi:integrase
VAPFACVSQPTNSHADFAIAFKCPRTCSALAPPPIAWAINSDQAVKSLRCGASFADDYLFPGADRKQPLHSIKKSWTKILKRSGIERFRLHDLRHDYASVLASRGASLHEIGRQLGHTQMQTTMRYADLIRERQREVAALFTLPQLPAPDERAAQ